MEVFPIGRRPPGILTWQTCGPWISPQGLGQDTAVLAFIFIHRQDSISTTESLVEQARQRWDELGGWWSSSGQLKD